MIVSSLISTAGIWPFFWQALLQAYRLHILISRYGCDWNVEDEEGQHGWQDISFFLVFIYGHLKDSVIRLRLWEIRAFVEFCDSLTF